MFFLQIGKRPKVCKIVISEFCESKQLKLNRLVRELRVEILKVGSPTSSVLSCIVRGDVSVSENDNTSSASFTI